MDEDQDLFPELDERDYAMIEAANRSLDIRIDFDSLQSRLAAFSVAYAFSGQKQLKVEYCSRAAARQMAVDILADFFDRELIQPRTPLPPGIVDALS